MTRNKQGTRGFSRFGVSKMIGFVDALLSRAIWFKNRGGEMMDYGVQAFKDLILFYLVSITYIKRE